MIIYEMEQGTEEWMAVRCGKITASNFKTAMAGGTGKIRKDLMYKLKQEIRERKSAETYSNKNMLEGIEKEPLAREHYEIRHSCKVQEIGFIEYNEWIGCSPDGLIGDNGMLEIKCPLGHTHARYLDENRLPPAYKEQVMGQLWIAKRDWCDFMSFRPEDPEEPYFFKRVYRDEEYIKDLEIQIVMFVIELKKMVETITRNPF